VTEKQERKKMYSLKGVRLRNIMCPLFEWVINILNSCPDCYVSLVEADLYVVKILRSFFFFKYRNIV